MSYISDSIPASYLKGSQLMLGVIAFTACQTALRIAYIKGYLSCSTAPEYLAAINNGVVEFHGNAWEGVNYIRSCLVGGLLVCAMGIYFQRYLSVLVSLLASLFLEGIFIWWYLATLTDLRELEVVSFAQLQGANGQHFMPLVFATWWDISVLLTATVSLLWNARILLATRRNPRS